MFLTPVLKLMAEKQASDLFISVGTPMCIKILGTIMPVNADVMDGPTVKKIAYELMEARDSADDRSTEIVRIEQLYPFPSEPLVKRLAAMPKLEALVWAQEEPRNNGAWFFVEPLIEQCLTDAGFTEMRPQYAGRNASASPATGLAKRHATEQAALIAAALGHSSPAEGPAVAAQ